MTFRNKIILTIMTGIIFWFGIAFLFLVIPRKKYD